jgi:ferredoxin-NADP reductase
MVIQMMEDIKKFMEAGKKKKIKEKSIKSPRFFDGLANLCDQIHPIQQNVKVAKIKRLSHNTKSFRLIPKDTLKLLAPFRAGQYISITVEIDGIRTSRPYSLVSSPNQIEYYEIAIKKKEKGFVSKYFFNKVKRGDEFFISEPMGNFYYNPIFHGNKLVFIAGGCGITPFISMLRNMVEKRFPIEIVLLYGCLTQKDILFYNELKEFQLYNSNIKLKIILSEPENQWDGDIGFITSEIILENIDSIHDHHFYVVGKKSMYDFIKTQFTNLNIPRHKVVYEAHGVPDNIIQIDGWPKNVNSSKKVNLRIKFNHQSKIKVDTFEVLCINPILNSIERNLGHLIEINNACRSGECALCRTKLVSGKIFVSPEVSIREVDRKYGYIHPCVSFPLSDINIDLTKTQN